MTGGHIHEWLVKRGTLGEERQYLLFEPANCVPVHEHCHGQHGNSLEMTKRCLRFCSRTMTASTIGGWYVNLWRKHKVDVPKGILVEYRDHRIMQCLDYLRIGVDLYNEEMPPDEHFMIHQGELTNLVSWDYRSMAAMRWMGVRRKGYHPPPDSYAGVPLERVTFLMDEGYWYHYLAGVASATPLIVPP